SLFGVATPYGCTQSVVGIVGPSDTLFQVAVGHDGNNGAELLYGHEFAVVRQTGDDGRLDVVAFVRVFLESAAFVDDGPRPPGVSHQLGHLFELARIVKGTHRHFRIKAVADDVGVHALGQLRDELV